MRLGGTFFRAETNAELEALIPRLDTYGLSTIQAPKQIVDMTAESAASFGDRARGLGLTVGEAFIHVNIMTRDLDARAERIQRVRTLVQRAVDMGSRCALIMLGSVDPLDGQGTPHPYMFTDECKAEAQQLVLRILDGLELGDTKFVIEPWNHSFFYQPEGILEFIKMVDHPSFGVHMDMMNVVSQQRYFQVTDVINECFDLLAPYIASVHFKDIRWDPHYVPLKFDEVPIGDGILDYSTYLSRIKSDLDPDITGYCERLKSEADYALNFARLRHEADRVGLRFTAREDGL